jgi:hypothetical protein
MPNLTGEGPEGLESIFLLIGFQTNRAVRLAFMMREVRNRGLGLGVAVQIVRRMRIAARHLRSQEKGWHGSC